MAVTFKKSAIVTDKTSVKDVFAALQKVKGKAVGSYGGRAVNTDRIPTGMFPLDLAIGGGFPRGKTTLIYGPESSGKTNLALLAIANHQKLWPNEVCIFIDLENEFNSEWAALLGVDIDRLLVLEPKYAEEAVDMVEAVMQTTDCGLVVLDSIAALTGTAELGKSAEDAIVGGVSLVMGKLYRKTVNAMATANADGRYPSLIYINQTTTKIGVMFGNPETTPGGKKPYFQAALILRVHGDNILDSKVSETLPVAKKTDFTVRKWKVPITSTKGGFQMNTQYYKGVPAGQCDDFNTVSQYLKDFGLFHKGPKDKGWVINGNDYKVIDEFRERMTSDVLFARAIRKTIVQTVMNGGEVLEEGGVEGIVA